MTLLRSVFLAITLVMFAPSALAATQGDTLDTQGMDYLESRRVLASDVWQPNQVMTRGEFVRMVTMLVYEHDVNPSCFSQLATQSPVKYRLLFREVTLQDPLAEFLCAGLKAGIIHGNTDGTFRADSPITVAEASQILYRAYDVGPLNRESLKGHAWYAQSMHDLQVAEVLPGTLYDTPAHLVTYGEAGEMFLRLRIREMSLRQAGDVRLMRGASLDKEQVSTGTLPDAPVSMPIESKTADVPTTEADAQLIRDMSTTDTAPLGYVTVWARGIEWTIPHPVSLR